MGYYSWICPLCRTPVNEGERAVIITRGPYDGFGAADDAGTMGNPCGFFHELCFAEAFPDPAIFRMGASDPDQGGAHPRARFMEVHRR